MLYWINNMIWVCKDKKIECSERTLIMAIINVTPDSFSDGGDSFSPEKAAENAIKAQENGADIIDLGAQSTRPGYTEISAREEWSRLAPMFERIKGKIKIPISVDTYFPYVAERAADNGADIINDVSGIINPEMADVIKKTGCGWVIMHNGAGNITDVKAFFERSVKEASLLGVKKESLCLDMGIGFGKNRRQDQELIANVRKYRPAEYPLLLGTSRKRVIAQISGQPEPKNRVYGNIAADTVAILGGVNIIRLHDVENEKQGIKAADALKRALMK